MSLEPIEYLKHVKAEIVFIIQNSSNAVYDDFIYDEVLKKALCRSVEIIGEAVKNIPEDWKSSHPEIPWKDIAGTRDKLIHDYFDIDFELLWDISRVDIPELQPHIEKMLKEYS